MSVVIKLFDVFQMWWRSWLAVLAAAALAALGAHASPCSFNSMCTCKDKEVACVGVPFHHLPGESLHRSTIFYTKTV